ncbi:hypothetical protein AN958_08495 [Leucoagaricus sp. SymC.cos]|nr:hypothetical protein AN958_08495 [Leucoagaricus sp. SymC.cos]
MDPNGTNPYPSPPLSFNSPNVPEDQVTAPDSSILHRTTISVVGDLASRETQRQLQQTSTALNAAYNRIRQVRRSLLELSESLPVTFNSLRLQEVAIGDTSSLSPEFLQSSVEERSRSSWNQVRPRSRPATDSPSVRYSRSQQRDTSLSVPWSESTLRRASSADRDTQTDDGSTILGRRVTARLAATNHSIQDVGQIDEGTLSSIASVTRAYEDLEQVVSSISSRRRNSTAVPSRPLPSWTSTIAQRPSQGSSQLSPHESSQGTPLRSSLPNSTLLNSLPDLDTGNIPNNTQRDTGPSERLSLLSNFSVQNFPTPSTSNMPSRPPIFDEPLSYVPPDLVDPTSQSRYPPSPDSAFQGHRNYVVHRRYDLSGNELVHNITVDWDDGDPMSWLMPSSNVSRRHRNRFSSPRQNLELSRTSDITVSSPPPPPPPPQDESPTPSNSSESMPRRRGWARLDLDGNEIPSDEEEEFERSRADSRIRATRRAQILASMAQTTGIPVPTTPPPQGPTIYQNIKPPVVLRHDPSLSYPADFVNPLPMPLSEMVNSRKTVKRKSTLLPRNIIMAGR